jgi:hypothetical protein
MQDKAYIHCKRCANNCRIVVELDDNGIVSSAHRVLPYQSSAPSSNHGIDNLRNKGCRTETDVVGLSIENLRKQMH